MSDETKEAKQTLANEQKERIDRCGEKVRLILEEENCKFDVSVVLRSGQVIPQIHIVSKQDD